MKQPSKDDLSKVQRISLTEAAQLEPNVCLAGVGGALVAPNEAMVDPWLIAQPDDLFDIDIWISMSIPR